MAEIDSDHLHLDFSVLNRYRDRRDELVKLIMLGPRTKHGSLEYVEAEFELPHRLFCNCSIKQDASFTFPVELNVYAFITGRNYPKVHAADYQEFAAFDPILSKELGERSELSLDDESEDYVYSTKFESLQVAVDRIFTLTDRILSIVQRGIVRQDLDELLSQQESEYLEFNIQWFLTHREMRRIEKPTTKSQRQYAHS